MNRHPNHVLWIVGAVTLAACALVSWMHAPVPLTHDEFSYLLGGELIASGHWSLPTHPMWEHFETMHVLQRPSYASKYPPGQALVLALGMRLFGHAIVGVWLATAGAAMAVGWMLVGWLRSPRAAWGGLVVGLHPMLLVGWADTYWGGSLAAAGGALAYGALPRLLERPSARSGAALGLGLGLLALTRPFEGAVAALPVAVVLAAALVGRRGAALRAGFARWALTVGALLAAALGLIAANNHAVTGSIWRLPYAEFHAQYEVVPVFLFQDEAPAPEYRHEVLRDFFTRAEPGAYDERQRLTGFIEGSVQRLASQLTFFVGWTLVPLVLGLFLARREREVRFALACMALAVVVLLVETFGWTHYVAPFVGVGVFLVLSAARSVWNWRGGMAAVRIALIVLVVLGFAEQGRRALGVARFRDSLDLARREQVERDLEQRGGLHLIVVRYAADHNPHLEWVFNAADIDAASVVWAREMDAERNAALLAYYADRSAWLLRPEENAEVVVPYPR